MKFIPKKDIKWDIVKHRAKHTPWIVLGWPIIVYITNNVTLLHATKTGSFRGYLEIRIPFTSRIAWTWDGEYTGKEDLYPVISHKTICFCWNGWFWFWKEF